VGVAVGVSVAVAVAVGVAVAVAVAASVGCSVGRGVAVALIPPISAATEGAQISKAAAATATAGIHSLLHQTIQLSHHMHECKIEVTPPIIAVTSSTCHPATTVGRS
jgi:hypothetical protein